MLLRAMRPDLVERERLEHEVQEAWEALRYWERRQETLSPLRRHARREAAAHAEAWRGRVKDAERALYGPPVWEPLALALRLHHVPARVARMRRRVRRVAIIGVASTAALAGGAAATAVVIVERVLGG